MVTRSLDLFRKHGSASASVDMLRAQFSGLPLLDELDDETLKKIEPELEWFSIPGGWELFHKGDESDGLYIVKSGCLGVMSEEEDGRLVLIAQIHPDQIVGEVSLISGQPRSTTVMAFRDTEVLRLKKDNFLKLVEQHPQLHAHINRILARRMQRITSLQTPVDTSRTIALVPVTENIPCSEFARGLHDAVMELGLRTRVIDSASAEKGTEWFCDIDCTHDLVLYEATHDVTGWTRLCFRQADRILLVVDPGAPLPDLRAIESLIGDHRIQRTEIVFLQPPDASRPKPAGDWLTRLKIDAHWHVRRGHSEDIARIARLMTGRAVSLVLSGGGARGFAHLGAIKAFREFGIPIDLVGGTSMGAIIGAGMALEWSDSELERSLRHCFVETNPLSDLTFPAIALFKGRKVSRLLHEQFGDIRIEDLWRPYFCLTSNLTKGTSQVNRRGLLWRALRASVAIPGLLPPMVVGGDLIADGGVINNFPVDIAYAARRGPIIGVDVANYSPFGDVPPDYDRKSLFWLWCNRSKKVPGIVNLLMRAGTISGDMKARDSKRHLALLVEPKMQGIELRDWQSFNQAVDAGYEQAVAILKQTDLTALTGRGIAGLN